MFPPLPALAVLSASVTLASCAVPSLWMPPPAVALLPAIVESAASSEPVFSMPPPFAAEFPATVLATSDSVASAAIPRRARRCRRRCWR